MVLIEGNLEHFKIKNSILLTDYIKSLELKNVDKLILEKLQTSEFIIAESKELNSIKQNFPDIQ